MSNEGKTPADTSPTGAPISHNKGLPKAPADSVTPDPTQLRVCWKDLGPHHWVLATDNGEPVATITCPPASGSAAYEFDCVGKQGSRKTIEEAKASIGVFVKIAASNLGLTVVYVDQRRHG